MHTKARREGVWVGASLLPPVTLIYPICWWTFWTGSRCCIICCKHFYRSTSAFLLKSHAYVEKYRPVNGSMSVRAIMCNGSGSKNTLSVWHLCICRIRFAVIVSDQRLCGPCNGYRLIPTSTPISWNVGFYFLTATFFLSYLVNLLYIRIMNSKFTVVSSSARAVSSATRFCTDRPRAPETHILYIHGSYRRTSAHKFTTDTSTAAISVIFPWEDKSKTCIIYLCLVLFPLSSLYTRTHARTRAH